MSGSRVDEAREMPAGSVVPGMFTPPTWRASKGAEILMEAGLAMAILRGGEGMRAWGRRACGRVKAVFRTDGARR